MVPGRRVLSKFAHYGEQMRGGEMRGEEKWNCSCAVKRVGMGEAKEVRRRRRM